MSSLGKLRLTLTAGLCGVFLAITHTFAQSSQPSMHSSSQPAPQQAPAPAIWSVSDDDSTVHIFGSIHLLTAEVPWFTDEIAARFEQSDSLTLEVSLADMDPAVVRTTMQELGYYGPDNNLERHLPEAVYRKLKTIAQDIQLPMQAVNQMKPWLVGVNIVALYAQRHGYLPQHGVEKVLTDKAVAANMPVFGFESVAEQLQLFADLSEPAQIAWLKQSLDEIDDIDSYFQKIKESWLSGDSERLAAQLNEGLDEVPGLAKSLLYDRNARWVPQIESLLDTPGQHFVAVGAGHLVGENSVIDLLREAGYGVVRH